MMGQISKGRSPSPIQMVGVGSSKGLGFRVAPERSLSGVVVGVKEGVSSPNSFSLLRSYEVEVMEDHHPRETKESRIYETSSSRIMAGRLKFWKEEEHAQRYGPSSPPSSSPFLD